MPSRSLNASLDADSSSDRANPASPPEENFATGRRRLILLGAVCALGVSAMMTQLSLMRELLSAFSGNEMVLGIVLGNWLLLTGIGSLVGKTASRLKRPVMALVFAQIFVAVLPIAQVFLLRSLRNVVFVRGAMVGVAETVISCFVLLVPYCSITGYLLALAPRLLSRREDASSIGEVYFLDSIGDILGGFVFTFVLVHFLDHFRILYFPALLNLFFAAALAVALGRRILLGSVCLIATALLAVMVLVDLDHLATGLQYAPLKVVHRGNSPYGNLVVTESAGQHDFVESGVPLFSTDNVEQVEESVHYAMIQRPRSARVLLISGGVSGTAKEILKYPVQKVQYVELDPMIVEVALRYRPEDLYDRRIDIINTDGRAFVRQTSCKYDVVIADLPDPSTSQINRFYTIEFFRQVKRILEPSGVFSFTLGRYENYVSEELGSLIAIAHRTLQEAFENVELLPTGEITFLASDGEITTDIAARLEQRGIPTQFVNRYYLQAVMTPDRFADIQRMLSRESQINRDFAPILYYHHLRYWLSKFEFRFAIPAVVLAGVLAMYVIRLRPVPMAIFTTGFTGSGLVVVLVLALQIVSGSVYHKVGMIVTVFMGGLALGSLIMNRILPRRTRKDLVKLEFAIALFACITPIALMGMARVEFGRVSIVLAEIGVALLTLILAVLVGMEFPLAGKEHFRTVTSTAAEIYAADLIGATLGAILVSTLLIPLIGIVWVCVLAGALNCVTGVITGVTGRR